MSDALAEWWLKGGRLNDRRLREDVQSFNVELFETPNPSAVGPSCAHSELHGTLTARVDRMAASVDALVELVDVRAELGTFTLAAMARLATRRRLAAVSRRVPPPGERDRHGARARAVEDVAGYWLPPALVALDDLLSGGDGGAEREEALRRDGPRSALFWMLALNTGHAVPGGHPPLGPLLPDRPVDQVSRAGRLAWVAAAEGRFGVEGRVRFGRRLDELMDHLNALEWELNSRRWEDSIASVPLPSPVEIAAPLTTNDGGPLVAAARLEVLASWCSPVGRGAAAGTVDAPHLDRDDAPTHELPSVPRSPGARQVGAPRGPAERESAVSMLHSPPPPSPAARGAAVDAIVELLRYLVEEGSPPERELARRDAQLRDIVRGSRPVSVPSLDDPVGGVADLLYRDAFSGTHAQRSFSLWVRRKWVMEGVASLVSAAQEPPASMVLVRVGDAELIVGEVPPHPWEVLVAARTATMTARPESGTHNPITRRRESQDREDFEQDLAARLQTAADRAATVLAEHRTRCAEAAKAAVACGDAIRRALGL